MIKYRVNKRSAGYAIEQCSNNYKWTRRGDLYRHHSSACEKMKQLRNAVDAKYKSSVGARIVASMPFCSNVI